MRRVRRWLEPAVPIVALVVASAAPPACHRPDSILLVEVAGDETLMVAQLQATVTVGAETRSFGVPPTPTAISLPASFSVELANNLTGPVTVHVDAFDGASNVLGSGDTTQDHINPGGQTIITVTIASAVALAASTTGLHEDAGPPFGGEP
jgi:hypothetical protein